MTRCTMVKLPSSAPSSGSAPSNTWTWTSSSKRMASPQTPSHRGIRRPHTDRRRIHRCVRCPPCRRVQRWLMALCHPHRHTHSATGHLGKPRCDTPPNHRHICRSHHRRIRRSHHRSSCRSSNRPRPHHNRHNHKSQSHPTPYLPPPRCPTTSR